MYEDRATVEKNFGLCFPVCSDVTQPVSDIRAEGTQSC